MSLPRPSISPPRERYNHRSLGRNQNCCPRRHRHRHRGDSHAAATTSPGGSRARRRPLSPRQLPRLAAASLQGSCLDETPKTAKPCLPPLFTRQSGGPPKSPAPCPPSAGLGAPRRLRWARARSFVQVRVHCVCFRAGRRQPRTASLWLLTGLSYPAQVMQPILVSSVWFFSPAALYLSSIILHVKEQQIRTL